MYMKNSTASNYAWLPTFYLYYQSYNLTPTYWFKIQALQYTIDRFRDK